MDKVVGIFLVVVLAFLVVIMQFAYAPTDNTSYTKYREDYAHNLKNPLFEKYKELSFEEKSNNKGS